MATRGTHTVRLPDPIRACLFDLDGVLTDTARVHAAAWKETFDGYLSHTLPAPATSRGPSTSSRTSTTT